MKGRKMASLPNCLSNNECNSTPGDNTIVNVNIAPYFPVRKTTPSPISHGHSWLANGSWGDYGHNRSNGKRSHAGCDIYTQVDEPVYAVKSGTIISSETVSNSPGWGGAGAITVDHGDYIIRYGEVKNITQLSGPVVQGQRLAIVSNTTFYPAQAMLHLEMYNKTATGPLTNPNSPKKVNGRPIRRRVDSINPTHYLESWINNLPPESS